MPVDLLARKDAPFGEEIWEAIDAAVVGAARSQLTGRRLLEIEGPFGAGLISIPSGERGAGEPISISPSTPVPMIRKTFTLPARNIAAYEQTRLPMNLAPASTAATLCARMEDELIFFGSEALGVAGLTTAAGVQRRPLRDWADIGAAAENVIEAATGLDDAGFHGPYGLAVAPALYNRLLRRRPQGDSTELEHIERIVGDGVFKAPVLAGGAVLLAVGRPAASIVLGQDLATGFIGPVDEAYEFVISESLTLRLAEPGAVCVIEPSNQG